jgi:DNA-binding response OmpR family regulator
LILLDIKLPGKVGFEILKEIKSNDKFSKIPIIMVTGDTNCPHR